MEKKEKAKAEKTKKAAAGQAIRRKRSRNCLHRGMNIVSR